MKKHLFLVLSLLAGATSAFAQTDNSYIFTDKDGTEVPDGSVLNVKEAEIIDDGENVTVQLNSGLYVKVNTTEKYRGGCVEANVKSISNGGLLVCFPMACIPALTEPGTVETDPAMHSGWILTDNGVASLQSEWFPESASAYGTCDVDYRLKVYKAIEKNPGVFTYKFLAYGPTVTVNYIYSDPTGIDNATASKELKSVQYYDLSGRSVSKPASGVFVKKQVYGDGTTNVEKVILK